MISPKVISWQQHQDLPERLFQIIRIFISLSICYSLFNLNSKQGFQIIKIALKVHFEVLLTNMLFWMSNMDPLIIASGMSEAPLQTTFAMCASGSAIRLRSLLA